MKETTERVLLIGAVLLLLSGCQFMIINSHDEDYFNQQQRSSSLFLRGDVPMNASDYTGSYYPYFSGCLLVKDDNPRLIEWLAYHYYTLPLRHLVVAVDPHSQTSPIDVLQRWTRQNLTEAFLNRNFSNSLMTDNVVIGGNHKYSFDDSSSFNREYYNKQPFEMDIEVWTEDDFGFGYNKSRVENSTTVTFHRRRQTLFARTCSDYHKKQGRSWAAMVDSDEYIIFNYPHKDDPGNFFVSRINQVPPKENVPHPHIIDEDLIKGFRDHLPLISNSTVMEYLVKHKLEVPWSLEPCYVIPRLFVSAVESSQKVRKNANVDEYSWQKVNVSNLDTLRYFHTHYKHDFSNNGWAKVIIDVSRILNPASAKGDLSIHRPLSECPRPQQMYDNSLLRIQHYVGSWDAYNYRTDVRRSKNVYDKKSQVSKSTSYDIQDWLYHFISDSSSFEEIDKLLDGANDLQVDYNSWSELVSKREDSER